MPAIPRHPGSVMLHPSLFDPAAPPGADPARSPRADDLIPLSTLTSPPLVGIARLAADAAVVDARSDIEYRDLPCRTLISRCDSPRVPFEFQINPYRGCLFACAYCYARYTHEFMELDDW